MQKLRSMISLAPSYFAISKPMSKLLKTDSRIVCGVIASFRLEETSKKASC